MRADYYFMSLFLIFAYYVKRDKNYLLEDYDVEKLFESVNMDVYLVKDI